MQRKTLQPIPIRAAINATAPNSPSQPRGLIALKVRIIFGEQKALQSVRLAKDVPRYTLSFHLKKVGQPVNCVGDVSVNRGSPLLKSM